RHPRHASRLRGGHHSMSGVIAMPRLSDTMEDGVVIRWLRADGDEVREGEPVVEVETDKATTELPAPATGTLRIVVVAGDTVPVGAILANVGERIRATPIARRLAAHAGVPLAAVTPGSG